MPVQELKFVLQNQMDENCGLKPGTPQMVIKNVCDDIFSREKGAELVMRQK